MSQKQCWPQHLLKHKAPPPGSMHPLVPTLRAPGTGQRSLEKPHGLPLSSPPSTRRQHHQCAAARAGSRAPPAAQDPQLPQNGRATRTSGHTQHTAHAQHTQPSRLPVPVGRHTGLCLLVTVPSAQHNTTQHNTTQHNTTQHNTTQHNTTQHNTTQHNTTQHNTTQHSTAQPHTTPHHTTPLCTTPPRTRTPPLPPPPFPSTPSHPVLHPTPHHFASPQTRPQFQSQHRLQQPTYNSATRPTHLCIPTLTCHTLLCVVFAVRMISQVTPLIQIRWCPKSLLVVTA